MRREIGTTMATVMVLLTSLVLPAGAGGDTFLDDDGSVHEANIELIAEAGITLGCGDGSFCPDDPVTRGQMASFVVRALGYVDDGGGDLFTDDDGSPHEANIDRLAAAGVTLGCGIGSFCPDDPVTRGQMASFIARAFHYDQAAAGGDHFSDDDGSTHEANINLLFEAGVTQGCAAGPTSFCPNDPVTRAQMASFLARALKLPWPVDQSDHPDLVPETDDLLGNALALGDFNADGWDDIAIGIRGENNSQGAVRIVYGTAGGPTGTTQFFTDTDFGETPQDGAFLGASLAVGDFDDDGYPDLAIGAGDPGAPAGNVARVMLARGGPTGLTPEGEILRGSMNTYTVWTMAAGQFGNGPADDLAVGFPTRTISGEPNAGLVEVIYGSPTGFTTPIQYHQNTDGVAGVPEEDDRFGHHVAAGDLTGDGFDELVISVSGEDLNSTLDEINVGVVHVFYGTEAGLEVDQGTSPELIDQADIGAVNENGDRFGSSVVIGDFTGDGIGDLIVGAAGEDLETPIDVERRGNVHVIPGSGNGPVGSTAFDLDTVAGPDQPLDARSNLGSAMTYIGGVRPTVVIPRATDLPSVGVFLLRTDGFDNLDTPLLSPGFELDEDVLSSAIGDINGDGLSDVVIGSLVLPASGSPSLPAAGGVAVWLGQDDGTLKPWPGGLIQ